MADHGFMLNACNSVSGRLAVVEDNGIVGWLYLTETAGRKPVADVWLYNRINAPAAKQVQSYRGSPPPAPTGFVTDAAIQTPGEGDSWLFQWSEDGESVALLRDGQAMAWLSADSKSGYTRLLLKDGPWGKQWDQELFDRLFADADSREAKS
ncbi:MAG: hypothetical protein KDA91_02845 [Planctomycetaceae bacterium]|nr:hypothetical protein [Planctomycetaceae bacterium]